MLRSFMVQCMHNLRAIDVARNVYSIHVVPAQHQHKLSQTKEKSEGTNSNRVRVQ